MNVIPQRVRDGFEKLIEPLAVVFIRLHIRPNLITTVGTLVVIASATAFGLGWVRSGGLLLLVSGVRSEEHRLNSSHLVISYAVFCLKQKTMPSSSETFLSPSQ